MSRIHQRSIKQRILPLLVALCTFAPLSAFGALYPVEQNSNPSGLVSSSAVIEGGQTYQSIDPQLNSIIVGSPFGLTVPLNMVHHPMKIMRDLLGQLRLGQLFF